jgi:predicted dehydrogenase
VYSTLDELLGDERAEMVDIAVVPWAQPDIGPMASLLTAIGTGGTPATAAQDNLRTIKLVHALYASMNSGDAVQVDYS